MGSRGPRALCTTGKSDGSLAGVDRLSQAGGPTDRVHWGWAREGRAPPHLAVLALCLSSKHCNDCNDCPGLIGAAGLAMQRGRQAFACVAADLPRQGVAPGA